MNEEKKITVLKLLSSHDEVGDVRTFVFDANGLVWLAGQSQGYILPQAGDSEAENQRWFTIASAPSEKVIHIATRVSSSTFKQTLNTLKPGDSIQSYDLGGDFTWEEVSDVSVVLVAGGIGITPFRSMLVERASQGKPLNATVLYFNRTDAVPFRVELEALAAIHPELHLHIIIGQHISAETILASEPQAQQRTVYISGPEAMVESVGTALRNYGISIKQDWFPGYTEKNY